MEIDPDIQRIIVGIEKGHHTIEETILRFLESLPGYEYRFHRPLTIKSYEQCLLRDPNNFNGYMKKEGVLQIDLVRKDQLEFYKVHILNNMDSRTAAKFITAVRQMFKYAAKIAWIEINIASDYELPKAPTKREIEVIKPEVCDLLLNGNWAARF
jgi:site-specific recombinase XerD